MERLGSVWECPDYFRLDGKDVLLFSPPDVQAQGNELHNGNNAIYVVGTYDHAKSSFKWGSHIHLIKVWILCITDDRTSGWKENPDRMDAVMA